MTPRERQAIQPLYDAIVEIAGEMLIAFPAWTDPRYVKVAEQGHAMRERARVALASFQAANITGLDE